MDPKLLARLMVLSLTATGVTALQRTPAQNAPLYRGVDAAESAHLRALERNDLAELRGDTLPERAALAPFDREALRTAQANSAGLEQLRGAGVNLSDRDLRIILVTAAVIILAVLIF